MEPDLTSLPNDVLFLILRHLGSKELAALRGQNLRFKDLASANELWQVACRDWWPRASLHPAYTSWCSMFRTRARMPQSFCISIDKIALLQREAASGPAAAHIRFFNDTMQSIFSVGLALNVDKLLLRKSVEYKVLCEAVLWWITNAASVVIAFVKTTNEDMQIYDMWTCNYPRFHDMLWRRSAIAFFQGIARSTSTWANPALLERLSSEVEAVDSTIRSIEAEADGLRVKPPSNLPRDHWWFFLEGSSSLQVC